MKDQYSYIGPALMEMRTFPVELVRRSDTAAPVEPYEVWLPLCHTWLRLNGEWVSGWRGDEHFGFRPGFWNRMKIRMAARVYLKANQLTPRNR